MYQGNKVKNLKIETEGVKTKEDIKHLGVKLGKNCKFRYHVEDITKKSDKTTTALLRLMGWRTSLDQIRRKGSLSGAIHQAVCDDLGKDNAVQTIRGYTRAV